MEISAMKNSSRRNFLRTAPVAAAAGLALTEVSLFPAQAAGESAPLVPRPFQLFTAQSLEEDIKALQATPGVNTLVDGKTLPFMIALATETAQSAKEFEWHAGRDHIVQIIEGSTVFEIGGTPQGGRNTGPGEWLAPVSEGATRMALKKGDMLLIPRGTPHRRSTAESVTMILISPLGSAQA